MKAEKKEEVVSAILKLRRFLSELGITCSKTYETALFCDLFTYYDVEKLSLSGDMSGCWRLIEETDGKMDVSVCILESLTSKEAIFDLLKEKGIPLPEKWEKSTRIRGDDGYTVYECEVKHNGNTHLLSYEKKGLGPKCKIITETYKTVACDIS